jgi:hypothetical protein
MVPQRISIDGSISALHIPGTSPSTLGWQPDVLSFLFAPYVSIEARDSATNQIIFATDKAVIVTRSEELRVDQLSQVTLRWRAIGFIDEKTPATPNNYNQPAPAKTAGGPAKPPSRLITDIGATNLPAALQGLPQAGNLA